MLNWLREQLPDGPRYGFRIIAWSGVLALGIVLLLLPMGSDIQARAAVTAIGLLTVLMAQLRPSSLWNAGSTQEWRFIFGDRLTVWLMTTIGIAVGVGAWLIAIPNP